MNASRVWRLVLSADEHHGARRRYEVRGVNPVSFFLFHDHRLDVGDQILVARAVAEQRPQIVIVLAEEAGAQLTVGRPANARAVSAEGLRDRRDQPDLARRAIGKAILTRGFAALVRNLLQRPTRVNAPV